MRLASANHCRKCPIQAIHAHTTCSGYVRQRHESGGPKYAGPLIPCPMQSTLGHSHIPSSPSPTQGRRLWIPGQVNVLIHHPSLRSTCSGEPGCPSIGSQRIWYRGQIRMATPNTPLYARTILGLPPSGSDQEWERWDVGSSVAKARVLPF